MYLTFFFFVLPHQSGSAALVLHPQAFSSGVSSKLTPTYFSISHDSSISVKTPSAFPRMEASCIIARTISSCSRSALIFSSIHVSILTSAALSSSSLFLIGQHCNPYIVAGLITLCSSVSSAYSYWREFPLIPSIDTKCALCGCNIHTLTFQSWLNTELRYLKRCADVNSTI